MFHLSSRPPRIRLARGHFFITNRQAFGEAIFHFIRFRFGIAPIPLVGTTNGVVLGTNYQACRIRSRFRCDEWKRCCRGHCRHRRCRLSSSSRLSSSGYVVLVAAGVVEVTVVAGVVVVGRAFGKGSKVPEQVPRGGTAMPVMASGAIVPCVSNGGG